MLLRLLALILFLLPALSPTHAQEDLPDPVPAEELADPGGEFLLVGGVSLYLIDAGEADAPPVILLHGFGGSTFTWRDTITPLTDAGFRVIAYDRPPFGLSQKTGELELTLAAQADQLAALLDELGIEQAVLVGHSAGGGTISQFAVSHPDRITALVFVAGAVPIATEPRDSEEQEESDSPLGGLFEIASRLDPDDPNVVRLMRRFLTPERFVDILSSAYGSAFEVTDDVANGYARVLLVEGWESGLVRLLTAEDSTPFDTDTFLENASQVPVLIMWGEADTWVPLERGLALAERLPNANLVTYPEIGHLPMEEEVNQFNADLTTFLIALQSN